MKRKFREGGSVGRRLPNTPRSKVRGALRQLWLRSRERAAALKAGGYTCSICHRKQSVAKGREFKVQVHHKAGAIGNWEKVIDLIYAELLCSHEHLEILCEECHEKRHSEKPYYTEMCETCNHRGIDGGPAPAMVCEATKEDMGYIISWENGKRVSHKCPLLKKGIQP